MAIVTRIIASLALCLALLAPVAAQDLTGAQQQGLNDRVASFDAAMKASDMTGVMGVIPPKVLDKIASNYSISTADLIAASQQQIDEALKSIKLELFSMDLAAAESFTLSDGMIYVMIPTQTVMDLGAGGRHRSSTSTMALLDEGNWYLMAVDDAEQIAILKSVYPAMADVAFPTGTIEPVTE